MSAARQILEILADRDIEIRVTDGKLRYRPVESVSARLVAAMQEHKSEIICLLAADRWQLGDPLKWDNLDIPHDCPSCGPVIDVWWDVFDNPHCRLCDPPWLSLASKRVQGEWQA